MTRPILALAVAALALSPMAARAQEPGNVGTFKLPGGTEVITFEDHAAPRVVVDTFLDVGSSADFAGEGGIAAATAHAVWAGMPAAPTAAVAKLGGTSSVVVDRTVTHFQATLPAAALEGGMKAIGEAFSHPDWAKADMNQAQASFDAAAGAAQAKATDRAFQWFMEGAFDWAMGHPAYGSPGVRYTREELKAFFDRHYVPMHTKVVLVGDFATGKAVGQVVRSYAALLQRQPAVGNPPSKPAQPGRTAVRPERPLVLVGARGPEIGNAREQAAMAILQAVLAGSPSARLDRALEEPNMAKVVDARWVRYKGPGVFFAAVSARPDAVPVVEKGLGDLLAELRSNPISLDEHAKAMNAVAKAAEGYTRSLETRASALGLGAVEANDPYWPRTYPEIVRQISRQEVMAAAQKYLAPGEVKILVVAP
jgi:predicted Zn-dependent peptidase